MNELELLRRELDDVPFPDERSTELARAALRTEIEAAAPSPADSRRPSRRRWLRPTAGVAIGAAGAAVALVLVGPFGHGPARLDVASAAYEAFASKENGIWHVVVVETGSGTTGRGTGMNGGRIRNETWSTAGAPHVLRWIRSGRVLGMPTDTSEQVWSRCGWLYYSAAANVLSVSGPQRVSASPVGPPPDPAASYRAAYESGHVVYKGTTSFHGVPAYELVVRYRDKGYAARTTFIVRQDNFYPLRTSASITWSGGHGTDVLTYPTYELLPRTNENERQLRLAPHRNELVVPSLRSKPSTEPTCAKYAKPRLRP